MDTIQESEPSEEEWKTVHAKRRTYHPVEGKLSDSKRISHMSIQELIRTRIILGITQEHADQLCNFPAHTIKKVESNQYLPTSQQLVTIQHQLGVQLKMYT